MLVYLQMIESEADRSKFERLYERYRGLMFHVANKILQNDMDAEDAVHEAFCAIAKHMKNISAVDGNKTRAYIVTIVENKAIDIYRRKRRHVTVDFQEELTHRDYSPPGEGAAAQAMARLPDKYREVLVLKHFCGLKSREISELLGMSDGMVRQTLTRARSALREELEKEGIEV